jgi:hypothetical protein
VQVPAPLGVARERGRRTLEGDAAKDLRCRATSGSVRCGRDDQSEPEALRVLETQRVRVRAVRVTRPSRRLSQKPSASSEPTLKETVCTMPAPARPRRAPGYSKNVMSAPGLPVSSA